MEPPGPMAEDLAVPPILWLWPLALWVAYFNIIGSYTWGYGLVTFVCMVAASALLLAVQPASRWLGRRLPRRLRDRGSRAMVHGLLIALLACLFNVAIEARAGFVDRKSQLWDIALNTYRANEALLAQRNPYAHPTMQSAITPGPNVRLEGQRVTLYGVPYYRGFPYFPGMLLSYLPFQAALEGYNAFRWANSVFLSINLVVIGLLVRRLTPAAAVTPATLVALVAYLGVRAFPREVFQYALPDLVISTYALLGCLALAGRKPRTAGGFLGLAFACKALPGPLLVIPALAWLRGRPDQRAVLLFFLLASGLLLLPFVLWHAEAFLSATILYYLTLYHYGDNTSVWYFLPAAIQPLFLAAGGILSLAAAVVPARHRRKSVVVVVVGVFLAYLILMSFSKVTHLNFLWSVYPLGCVGLAVLSVTSALPEGTP